jgi:thiol-disulfide isomerase/thioredoxin
MEALQFEIEPQNVEAKSRGVNQCYGASPQVSGHRQAAGDNMRVTVVIVALTVVVNFSCQQGRNPEHSTTTVTASPIAVSDSERAHLRDSLSEVDAQYRKANPLANGKRAPHFQLHVLGSADSISNSKFAGKFYLIHFWGTHCGPCIAEMGDLQQAFQRSNHDRFAILSIALDNPRDVMQFRKSKWSMPWIHATIFENPESRITSTYNAWSIPCLYLIGPSGTILAQGDELRGKRLSVTLGKYLN